MAETLSEILGSLGPADPTTLNYLSHLAEQHVNSLESSEPQHLAQASHSLLVAVQAISQRSHGAVVRTAASHGSLRQTLPVLFKRAADLRQAVPRLDSQADNFSTEFSKARDSMVLTARKQALRLLQNSDRLVDVMEIPPLLASAVMANPVNYSTSLDLHAHARRLTSLYPESNLVSSVMEESDAAIRQMATDLIHSLKAPGLKLAAAVRTIGWLKRIIPDLVSGVQARDTLPALFLVCRLATLLSTLGALDPLRQLADEERLRQTRSSQTWSGGQQTERFLKRFIEIFREHSFNIISVFKSIDASFSQMDHETKDPLLSLPSALATLPLHLVDMLLETLRTYLPTIKDQTARDSILTQVLYCAGSLGRLGADFGLLLVAIGMREWIDLVQRHRLLAGRLESVIGESKRHGKSAAFPSS